MTELLLLRGMRMMRSMRMLRMLFRRASGLSSSPVRIFSSNIHCSLIASNAEFVFVIKAKLGDFAASASATASASTSAAALPRVGFRSLRRRWLGGLRSLLLGLCFTR